MDIATLPAAAARSSDSSATDSRQSIEVLRRDAVPDSFEGRERRTLRETVHLRRIAAVAVVVTPS
jgi:hypothetical protein